MTKEGCDFWPQLCREVVKISARENETTKSTCIIRLSNLSDCYRGCPLRDFGECKEGPAYEAGELHGTGKSSSKRMR